MRGYVMRFLIIFTAFISSFTTQALTVEGQSSSLYQAIVDEFEKPVTGVLGFDELYGNYIGRCYTFDKQDDANGALLVISKKKVSDNGPLFPASYERKALNFMGYTEETYNDEMKFLPRKFKFVVAVNWQSHSELSQLGDSWEFNEQTEDTYSYIKNTEKGLMLVTYLNNGSTGNLLEEDLVDFKARSYKGILRACYYFTKFAGEETLDPDEIRP